MQNLESGLAELHEVHIGPNLKPVMVPLNCTPSLQCINSTTQLEVSSSNLLSVLYVINKDIEQYWPQYRPLRNTMCY